MRVKEESEKTGLKLNIQKSKSMTSSPITSWQIDGETMQTARFIFLVSIITAVHDWSHKVKRHLFLGRKAKTNLHSVFKSRHITLPTKVHLVKAMVFLVVMYQCESWTIKRPEWQRSDAFKLWCWRRLLRVLWTARRSNQSILRKSTLNIHWNDWCWSWSSSTLATWRKVSTHWKRPWCWERLKGGGDRGDRGWDDGMASPIQQAWVWANSWEMVKDGEAWHAAAHGVADWDTTQPLSNNNGSSGPCKLGP